MVARVIPINRAPPTVQSKHLTHKMNKALDKMPQQVVNQLFEEQDVSKFNSIAFVTGSWRCRKCHFFSEIHRVDSSYCRNCGKYLFGF